MPPQNGWNIGHTIDIGRYLLFLISNPFSGDTTHSWENLSVADITFGIFTIFLWLSKFLTEMFFETFCFAVVLTMWTATRLFVRCFQIENQMKWRNIHEQYKVLRHLAEMMNYNFASFLGLYLVTSSIFLLSTLHLIPTPQPKGFYVCQCISQIVVIVTLVLAANIPAQMNEMKTWLARNLGDIPERDYAAMTNELQWNMVGVQGGRNMFTITYAVLWNVRTRIVLPIFLIFNTFCVFEINLCIK